MKKETEVKESLSSFAKEMAGAKGELERADIVLKTFALLANENKEEIEARLIKQMEEDIVPHQKDPIYMDGMIEGLSLAHTIIGDAADLRVTQLLAVSCAVLMKIRHKNIV